MTDTAKKCCGSCKWLTGGIEAHHRKKDGTVKERYRFSMFQCSVPFYMPERVPACIRFQASDRTYMAPYYGTECAFHERIVT